jgi:hypothetical protein
MIAANLVTVVSGNRSHLLGSLCCYSYAITQPDETRALLFHGCAAPAGAGTERPWPSGMAPQQRGPSDQRERTARKEDAYYAAHGIRVRAENARAVTILWNQSTSTSDRGLFLPRPLRRVERRHSLALAACSSCAAAARRDATWDLVVVSVRSPLFGASSAGPARDEMNKWLFSYWAYTRPRPALPPAPPHTKIIKKGSSWGLVGWPVLFWPTEQSGPVLPHRFFPFPR